MRYSSATASYAADYRWAKSRRGAAEQLDGDDMTTPRRMSDFINGIDNSRRDLIETVFEITTGTQRGEACA